MLKSILAVLALISLSACAAYKVVPEKEIIIPENAEGTVSVTEVKESQYPEGLNCFEPMMTLITLGIIPTHCINNYSVSIGSHEIGQVKVTSMQGWVTLLMAPFPTWQYGYARNVENEISELTYVKK